MTTHTPGPWRAAKVRDYAGWTDVTTEAVLEEFGAETREGMVARVWTPEDARLIAAAPELLEALRDVVNTWDASDSLTSEHLGAFADALEHARVTISKAPGGTP